MGQKLYGPNSGALRLGDPAVKLTILDLLRTRIDLNDLNARLNWTLSKPLKTTTIGVNANFDII